MSVCNMESKRRCVAQKQQCQELNIAEPAKHTSVIMVLPDIYRPSEWMALLCMCGRLMSTYIFLIEGNDGGY